MRSSEPWPSFFQQRNTRLPSRIPPRHGVGMWVSRPISPRFSAIAPMASLKGEAGGYRVWIARLSSGRASSSFNARQFARVMPPTKTLGSYDGAE